MRIARGEWALDAAPERGGAILSLTRAGRDVLRPAPEGATAPLDMACFPLVPYANRIAHGRFAWVGREHRLPRNYPGQAHPLHGVGWLRPWHVTQTDEAAIAMRLDHDGDADWPWRFAAEQRLCLTPAGLSAELAIENRDDAAMPVSLGFHPYFPVATALRFDAAAVWLTDASLLPTDAAAPDALGDWSRGGPLERANLVDHCYTGWSGTATIVGDDGETVLRGTGAPALHVYVPPGAGFFCAEPVSALPDAVNRDAADTLAPGERRAIAMRIGTSQEA